MTCKDCIHYEVCERKDGTSTYTVEDPSLNVVKEINFINCGYFKDRSKFIELPCKVGDTVYIHYYNREKAKYEVTPIKNIQLSELAVLIEDNENVYLSEEEAEQALRERN